MTKKLISLVLVVLGSAVSTVAAQPDETALKKQYDAFVKLLDHSSLAVDYSGAMRNLDSPDPRRQTIGIKTLAATEEVKAIPWIVPFLDSQDRSVRIFAGQAIQNIVTSHELKRRDWSQPHKVVILPPGPNDLDLRPLSWLVLKMRSLPDDGNTDAFTATLIGYLRLNEYEADLRQRLESKHPAEAQAAAQALKMLDDAR